MMKPNEIYNRTMSSGEFPKTETEIKEKFDVTAKGVGLDFNNPSPFSPFWNLVRDLMIQPVLWLTDFIQKKGVA